MGAWRFDENLATLDALVASYSHKGRRYHTTEHVSACLRHLDSCASRLDSPREVEIALWFHDAVYEPFSSRNEEDSADWAASFLAGCGASPDEVDRVTRLITVTKHNAPAQTADEAALVDIDLAILGAEPATYGIFEDRIRKEYRLVPSFLYRQKRAAILRGFLARARLFTSGVFPEEFELQARENLSNAVFKLAGRA